MLSRFVMAGAFAVACAGIATAQTPAGSGQDPQRPTPQSESRATSQQGQSTTLFGCVYREQDVPGRTPNVAERAGVMEDYILAHTSTSSKESQPGTPGATGTSGTAAAMYKLEHAADEKLRAMVGKRVEVTGRIDAEAGDTKKPAGTTAQTERSVGPDQVELPEFEVTSIREVSGTCPASPKADK
jgi:hypothetical protein